MVQPEKRLLWHPRYDNKFVVGGGSQITLYEWASDHQEIRQVTSQHDLQHMKCFTWSPDPAFDDLVAIGHSTGKIELLRLETSKYVHRSKVLSSSPSVGLPLRNSRSCNSLAFCNADPNYLASGLDKVRGDHSLMIWDITTALPILSISPGQPQSTDTGTNPSPPHRPQPLIPRAEIGPRTDPRVLQQHAQTETVSSVCFLPHSTHLLLAGISYRWLRLFDLRSPVPSTINVASKIQGIATDPFDPHRIATFGDGTVSVWDSRKLLLPVLSFTERDASADGAYLRPNAAYTCVEFSGTRRGTLASLEKDSAYVRFWDLMSAQAYVVDDGLMDDGKSRELGRAGRRSWANIPWPSGSSGHQQTQQSPKEVDFQVSLLLSDTRRTKRFTRSLASFALVPSPQPHPLTSNVMVVHKEGDLELYALHDTPKQAVWNARGDLTISAGQSCRILEGFHPPAEPDQWDPHTPNLDYVYNFAPHSSHSRTRDDSDSLMRGKQKSTKQKPGPVVPLPPTSFPAFFGRGDEDGFPALSPATSTGLTATRSVQRRTYSPSEMKNYDVEQRTGGGGGGRDNANTSVVKRSRSLQRGVGRDVPEELRGRPTLAMAGRNQSSSRFRRPSGMKGVYQLVEGDISMIMRRRALRNYGLKTPQQNIFIAEDECEPSYGPTHMLPDLWAWISHSHNYLSTPTPILYGYNFAYQGLLGIWEGFQPLPTSGSEPTPSNSHLDLPSYHHPEKRPSYNSRRNSPIDELYGSFQTALAALAARRAGDRPWKPTIPTAKGLQRQIALQLCGWSLREDELMSTIKRWEKDEEYSRAACWLVFTKQYGKAIDLLLRSGDEAHRMMSGTVAALVPHSPSSKSPELRDHCERLIVKLQDPYFRAMLTHLAMNDWSDVLEEESLPFRERLAIAFQFLGDKDVSSYLRRCMERSLMRGEIDGIMIPGLASKQGLDILQGYVDRTGDVQSAAIMGSYVCPPGQVGYLGPSAETKVSRWVESYRDLLDGFKMFHWRVMFDIERGQVAFGDGSIPVPGGADCQWVPRQVLIRCNYCNKSISDSTPMDRGEVQQRSKPSACPHCNRALPRCSICLMTLSIVQDSAREAELSHSQPRDTIDDAIVMCQTCRHGGHAAHILDWFYGEDGERSHGVCAVAGCDCRCAEEM